MEAVRLTVRVTPNARRNEVVAVVSPTEIRLKICAPPQDGKANIETIRFLAELLGCRRSELTLVSGGKNRLKVVAVSGRTRGDIAQRLGAAVRTGSRE